MKAYVYILQSEEGVYYIGSTSNVEKRFEQHINGTSRYTKRLKGLKIVLVQECESMTIARKVENRIKNLKRKNYIEKMISDRVIKIKV